MHSTRQPEPGEAIVIEHVRLTDAEKRRRRVRSFAIAWALFAFVILFFAVTMVKLTGNVAHLPQ